MATTKGEEGEGGGREGGAGGRRRCGSGGARLSAVGLW